MQIRTNAEGIAFYGAGDLEKHHTDSIFDKLLRTQQRLVLWEFPLNCKSVGIILILEECNPFLTGYIFAEPKLGTV